MKKIDVTDVGAPDPELENSPVMDAEIEEGEFSGADRERCSLSGRGLRLFRKRAVALRERCLGSQRVVLRVKALPESSTQERRHVALDRLCVGFHQVLVEFTD